MNGLPHRLALLLLSLAAGGCAANLSPVPSSIEENTVMSEPPSASRKAPPHVEPVVHAGVRYEQDMQSGKHGGDQPGGYLVAIDPASGERLWMLKVYEVPTQADAPFQPGRYFRSMRLAADGAHLEIENEAGGRYLVDLAARKAAWVAGPDPGRRQ
jgi:hypothetical protein